MGCGACSAAPVPEPTGKAEKPLIGVQIQQKPTRTESEVELTNLRTANSVLLSENEKLKNDLNREMSMLFPQVFTDTKFPEELVDDWLIMDLFEMDKYVNYLKYLFPPIEDKVNAILYTSAMNKQKETSLVEYLEYFRYRYEETGNILTIMGQERCDIDECVLATKSKIVQSIKIFEVFFGKKSDALDGLTGLFGKIGGLPVGVPFITGLQTFYEAALEFYRQAYEAKLEAAAQAKEEMRQYYEHLLQERDALFDRTKKRFEDILYKKMNEIEILKWTNHADIENQFDHFDIHLRKLNREFDERQRLLREEYQSIIDTLNEEIRQKDLRINFKEEEILALNGVTNDVRNTIRELEEHKRVNEERMEHIRQLLDEQMQRVEYLDQQMIIKAQVEEHCEELREELSNMTDEKDKIHNELQVALRQIAVQHSELAMRETHRLGEKGRMGERWRQLQALRVATRLIARARVEKTAIIFTWKTLSVYELEYTGQPIQRAPYPLNISDDVVHEVYTDEQQRFSAEIQQTIANITLSQNELLDVCSELDSEEKPMLTFHIFKIFEEMMGRKYDSDCYEIRHQRVPKSIPMFLLEHLARTLGVQPSATKALSQYMPRLRELQEGGHEYGLVICQLLQVYVDNPVHDLAGWFLTRVLSSFDVLTEKYVKVQADIKRKRGLKPTAPRDAIKKKPPTKPYFGKIAFLQDLLPLIVTIFEGNRIAGEKVSHWLKPQEVSVEEYAAFAVCERIAKMGRSSESVFKLIDTAGVGTITEVEFVNRLRETVEVWMQEVDLRMLFRTHMKSEKRMTMSQFVSCINFKVYPQNCVSKVYAVTTCTFLSVMIRVFQENEKVFTMQTKRLMEKRHISEVYYTQYCELMRDMDPVLSEKELRSMWQLGLLELKAEEPLSIEQFSMVPLMHPIGMLAESVFYEKETVKRLRNNSHSRANSYSDNAGGAYLGGQQIG